MRHLIDIVDLFEKAEKFDVRGRDVTVHINPHARALMALLQNAEYGLVRGFATPTDLYFWDANDAIHHQIWRQITDDPSDVIIFMMGFDLQTVIEDARREYGEENHFTFIEDPRLGFFYVSTNVEEKLLNNMPFGRMFNSRVIDVSDFKPMENALTETIEILSLNYTDVPVHVNPSRKVLRALLENSQFELVRGFTLGKDVFFWDADLAIHQQIYRKFTDNAADVSTFVLGMDFETVLDDAIGEGQKKNAFNFYEDEDIGFLHCLRPHSNQMLANPSFRQAFRNIQPVTY